jgi:hypothetical protein
VTRTFIAAAREMGFKEHFDINNTADWLEAAGQQGTNTDHSSDASRPYMATSIPR